MSAASRVESVFFAALDRKSAAERADYLDQACGADATLRLRVERLLEAHPKAEGFLARPAVDRPDSDLPDELDDLTSIAPSSGLEKVPREPMEVTEAIETVDLERQSGDERDSVLRFLEPSEKPGSMGRLAHYEVLEVVASGGFGIVVKAFDEKLHRLVAIKLLSPMLAATSAPGNASCARRGRPQPSAMKTSSPSTRSRTSPSHIW